MTTRGWRLSGGGLALVAAIGAALAGLAGIESAPPLWWDEGWTLCVARSWAELGHYGCLLDGAPAPATLSASFPVVAPIALSFRLLGVGVWQARLVGLLLSAATILLLYRLTASLAGRRVAAASLLLLLLPTQWQNQFLIVGRQALGEMPALCYLLGGYLCMLAALRGRLPLLIPAALLWGLALLTKLQVLPFWALSLLGPLALAALRREWRAAALVGAGLAGGLLAAELLRQGHLLLTAGRRLPGVPISGLQETLSLVLDGGVRLGALRYLLIFAAPAALGLGYEAWRWLRGPLRSAAISPEELARLMLLLLAGSWLAWFALLSIGWPRYAFPPQVLATPFVGALLHDLSAGYSWQRLRRSARAGWRAGAALALAGGILLLAGRSALLLGASEQHRSVVEAAAYLNSATPAGATVETYDSELLFLLDRPYSYPHPQVHVTLTRRAFIDPTEEIPFDPLQVQADYLVLGPYGSWTGLYDPAVDTGLYSEQAQVGAYRIFRRTR